MKPLLLPILILFLINIPVFAQDATTQASPQYSKDEKAEIATALGVVYVGMPKEDLEKAGFTEHSQKGYYKKGNEEWLTFSDWMTEESGDLITFYLVDGKVKGWKK